MRNKSVSKKITFKKRKCNLYITNEKQDEKVQVQNDLILGTFHSLKYFDVPRERVLIVKSQIYLKCLFQALLYYAN